MTVPKSALPQPVERLDVQVYQQRSEMGHAAAIQVANKMRELLAVKDRIRMIFAAAPSQNEMLAVLASAEGIDWSRVSVFHMDEYIGLPDEDPRGFGRFLADRLFELVKPGEVNLIKTSGNVDEECQRYSELLQKEPVDIVCLGIGENGHIAFNDPWVADFNDPKTMKVVELDEACRTQQVHDGCFSMIDEVPTRAVTLTIPALFAGGQLFCIVPGKTKYEAVQRTLYGPITEECPASILRTHPNCTFYLDRDSYGVK